MSDFHDDETTGPMRTVPAATRPRDAGPIAAVVAIVVVVAALVGSAMLSPTGVTPTLEVATALRPAAARLATAPTSAPASPAPAQTSLRTPRAAAVQFEPNLGQSPADARYVAHGPGFTAEVLADGVRMHQSRRPAARHGQPTAGADMVASARLRFVGADTTNALDAREPRTAVSSYLIGSDASRWLHDVPGYRQLRQPQIYPGVDLVYYGRDGEFEYDLVVQPKADASRIRLAIDGSRKPSIDAGGDLLLDGPGGALRMHRPVLYQHIDGVRKTLQGDYVMLASNEVGFRLPAYDHARPLIIDPTFKLLYSTYLGGVHDDQVGGMVLDAQSNAYIVGTSASEDWPVSGNAYQAKRKNIGTYVRNVVVTKFDASGNLVYSTFIGGSTNDYGNGIALDAAGNAYITGSTTSADFPVTANAIQSTPQGSGSAFLAVLSSDGSALSYSTLFGSSSAGRSVAFDAAGTLWLGGYAGPGLTTTANAYKTTLATGTGAFVAKFTLPPGRPGAVVGLDLLRQPTRHRRTNQGDRHLSCRRWRSTRPALHGSRPRPTRPTCRRPAAPCRRRHPPWMRAATTAPTPLNSFGFVGHFSADLSTLAYASYLTGKTRVPGDCAGVRLQRRIRPRGQCLHRWRHRLRRSSRPRSAPPRPPTPATAATTASSASSPKLKADGSAILWSSYLGGTTGDSFLSNVAADSTGSPWAFIATSGRQQLSSHERCVPAGARRRLVRRQPGSSRRWQRRARVRHLLRRLRAATAPRHWRSTPRATSTLAGTTGSTDLPVTSTPFQPNLTANAYDGSDWFFTILGTGAVSRVLPSASGNGGDVTLSAFGVGLQPGATALARLRRHHGRLAHRISRDRRRIGKLRVLAGRRRRRQLRPGHRQSRRHRHHQKGRVHSRCGRRPAIERASARPAEVPHRCADHLPARRLEHRHTGSDQWCRCGSRVPASASLAIDGFSVADTAAMLSVSDASKTYVNRFIGKLSPGESTTVSVHITTTADADFVAVSAALQAPWFRTADQFNGALTSDTYDSDCVPDSANPAYSNCLGPDEELRHPRHPRVRIGLRDLTRGREDRRPARPRPRRSVQGARPRDGRTRQGHRRRQGRSAQRQGPRRRWLGVQARRAQPGQGSDRLDQLQRRLRQRPVHGHHRRQQQRAEAGGALDDDAGARRRSLSDPPADHRRRRSSRRAPRWRRFGRARLIPTTRPARAATARPATSSAPMRRWPTRWSSRTSRARRLPAANVVVTSISSTRPKSTSRPSRSAPSRSAARPSPCPPDWPRTRRRWP